MGVRVAVLPARSEPVALALERVGGEGNGAAALDEWGPVDVDAVDVRGREASYDVVHRDAVDEHGEGGGGAEFEELGGPAVAEPLDAVSEPHRLADLADPVAGVHRGRLAGEVRDDR